MTAVGERNVYRNNKNGNLYVVLGIVTNTTNSVDGQQMVHYRNTDGKEFVREQEEFHQKFTRC